MKKQNNNTRREHWTFNMNRRINDLRADISKISQMNDPKPSPKMKRNSNAMRTKYKIESEEGKNNTLEILKQRLCALNNRLSRYQKREKQYQQNRDFIDKPSKLFDELRGNRINITNPPTENSIKEFWKPLYETQKEFNKNAVWLQEYKNSVNNTIEAEYDEITSNEVKLASAKFSNWKSPGVDKIQNFWWFKLPTLHPKILLTLGEAWVV